MTYGTRFCSLLLAEGVVEGAQQAGKACIGRSLPRPAGWRRRRLERKFVNNVPAAGTYLRVRFRRDGSVSIFRQLPPPRTTHGSGEQARAANKARASRRQPSSPCAAHLALYVGGRARRAPRDPDRSRPRQQTYGDGGLGVWLDAPVARLDHPRHGDPRMAVGNRDERDLPISDAT